LPGAASRRTSFSGRSALSSADCSDQGLDLTADGRIVSTLDGSLLHDNDVDITSVNLDEFQRQLLRREKPGRKVAGLPGHTSATQRENRRADLHVTPIITTNLGYFDRREVDLVGIWEHHQPRSAT
jgi:hypothetical protein